MARSSTAVIRQFTGASKSKQRELRSHLDGLGILGQLQTHLKALDDIDEELCDSIIETDREILDSEGEVIRTETYRSTILDKETIAVYHTRQAGRKVQIDTIMKMLNKVMPDLKAVDTNSDSRTAAERALAAFADAAAASQ